MSIRLFYDKFAGHHGIGTVVDGLEIESLDDGSFKLLINNEARQFLDKRFNNKTDLKFDPNYFTCGLYKLFVYLKTIENIETVLTVFEINLRFLDELINNKTEIPYKQLLHNICKWHQFYVDAEKRKNEQDFSDLIPLEKKIEKCINYVISKSKIPHDYTNDPRIPNFPKLSFSLFEYQKATIHWMINRENNPPTFNYSYEKEVPLGNKYFSLNSQKIRAANERSSITFNGGGLFDEVGLGKTIQMIVLSLLNTKNITDKKQLPTTNLLQSKATVIFCPNNLCGQWVREITSKLKEEYYEISIINETKVSTKGKRGTISKIVAHESVQKPKTGKEQIKIIKLLTKVDYDKITYQDLLEADFIIVSFTFITGTVYFKKMAELLQEKKNFHTKLWEGIGLNQIIKLINDIIIDNKNLNDTSVLLQKIFWHRVIIDEFHEVHTNKNYVAIVNLLRLIQSSFKWIVTATPFNDINNIGPFINLLTNYKEPKPTQALVIPEILNFVADECFRGITSQARDTIEQVRLPPLKEEIKWLNFSSTERLMYDAYLQDHNNYKDDIYLRQLCCHPQLAEETKLLLSNCKTLDEIELLMVNHYRDDMLAAKKVVDGTQKQINKCDLLIEYVTKKVKLNKIKRLYNFQQKSKKKVTADQVIIIEEMISLLKTNEDEELEELGIPVDDNEENEETEDLKITDREKLEAVDMKEIDTVLDKLIKDNPTYEDKTRPSATLVNLNQRKQDLIKRMTSEKNVQTGKENTLNFFVSIVEKLKRVSTKTKDLEKEAEIERLMSEGKFDDLMDEVDDDVEDECLICMAQITREDIGVTMCGHVFCYKCLTKSIEKSGTCPTCKNKLTKEKYFTVACKVEEQYNEKDSKTLIELTKKIGTKLANLVMLLKNSDEHTIVFSEWTELLTKIGRVLAENGVPNIFCKGTVFRRDKCIRDFNEKDDVKVIMLSTGNTASGTNLTRASRVVFVNPAHGTFEERQAIETQALGRAYRTGQTKEVTVVRLVIKNSIEEMIYHSNKERKQISNK